MSKENYQFITAVAYHNGVAINAITGVFDVNETNSIPKLLKKMKRINDKTDKVIIHELKRVNFVKKGEYSV